MRRPSDLKAGIFRAVIIGPSPRFLSGISYYTLRLSNALAGRSSLTTILFRHMLPTRLFPGWRRVGTPLSSMEYDRRVRVAEILDWYNPFTWLEAYRLIRSSDLVIIQWWTCSVAHMYLLLQILNQGRIPVLIEFHEVVDPLENSIAPIRIYSRVMGRLIRRYATRFAVHSDHDRSLVAVRYHIPAERISVIPHGLYDQYPVLSQERMKARLGVEGTYVYLFFGLLRPYKGVVHLIHAFEQLPAEIRDRSMLLIVGETWEDQVSAAEAAASPISDRIRLVSRYVSDEEVPVFFSAADTLLLPYTRASQSGVAHIGISYGLPIIASRVGGLGESLAGYDGTLFVPPGDEQALTRTMEAVYRSPGSRYPVNEHLRWETVAGKYSDEMSALVHKRGSA